MDEAAGPCKGASATAAGLSEGPALSLTTRLRADDLLAVDALQRALGPDLVQADPETRDYYSNDIFWQPGIPPLAVVTPTTREEAAAAVRLATDQGLSVVPRGGGMS